MVRILAIVSALVSVVDIAHAEVSVDLRAADPVATLPVVSADKQNFLRAYRRWKPKCKKPDIFVEDGGIDVSVDEPQYSSTQLVGGCGEAFDAFSGNVIAVNASMSHTKCGAAAKRDTITEKLPAHFEADGMQIDVTGTPGSAHISVNRLATKGFVGGRRMELEGSPTEVHGWYVVEQKKTLRQVAVLFATKAKDGTIMEKWMEVWAKPATAPKPIDIAQNWLLATAAKDTAALARSSAKTLTRADTGDHAARYGELFDEREFSTLDAKKLPPELADDAVALTKLAKAGHSLIEFTTSDSKGTATLAFAIKGGKVAAVFEHVGK
jgi:hypothetical protein